MDSGLNCHWKDWCWSWNSSTLATWCEELTHLKRPWCWERLKVGGGGDDRGWDGWMASPTQWTWVWTSYGCWWWTGRSGVLQFMGPQRVRHNWATELKWTENMQYNSIQQTFFDCPIHYQVLEKSLPGEYGQIYMPWACKMLWDSQYPRRFLKINICCFDCTWYIYLKI